MADSKLMNLRICDDVRDGPRGPLLGRVMVNAVPEDWHYIAVPFSETQPQAFSTRWDAYEYVEKRGKPAAATSIATTEASTDGANEGARTA